MLFAFRVLQNILNNILIIVEFPVLYSRSLLIIYFTYCSVYMSIPDS